jgi:hypothetical protein
MSKTIDNRLMVAIYHHPKYPTDVFNEVHFEADINASEGSSQSVQYAVNKIIREAGLTTTRKNPQTIPVKVFLIELNEGKLERKHTRLFQIVPPIARMTEDEFNEEQIRMIKDIPNEFHDSLTSVAWDMGGVDGYEEVISELSYLITEFTPAIREYKKNILKEFESVCLVGW